MSKRRMIRSELETDRLKLRLFTKGDLEVMFLLGSDPEVMRYVGPPCTDREEAMQALINGPLADYEKFGYGRFAVEWKETGDVIGFCGIKFIPEIELPEIGYRYLKEYWGRGIGTEAAEVCLEFARNDLGLDKLVALIMPGNTGSMRVAEKLGMTRGPMIPIYGSDSWQYEINLQE